MVDAVLNFSFEDAKAHLIKVDPRFSELFQRLKCKPFQQLDQVHPFRCVFGRRHGQQISWLAARSINHKFIRLYDPTLPEKPADYSHTKSPTSFFPSPHQVAHTDIVTLKSAGLSTRKAEYVQDLAARFSDGRLSTTKLLNANDEELLEILTEVRGIGRWTVDMFAIFTLRRQNILPVGDLGVQRGMVRWFGGTGIKVRPDKVGGGGSVQEGIKLVNDPGPASSSDSKVDYAGVGIVNTPRTDGTYEEPLLESTDSSRFPISPLSQPFTPSINKVLESGFSEGDSINSIIKPWMKQLPNGLTPTVIRSRLNGKKAKGVLLTPQEMEALAAEWVPYRSLAVYYMWALTDEN
ncbi:DNA glycosylase [Scleroderma yunnanense]